MRKLNYIIFFAFQVIFAFVYGVEQEDISMLLEFGYDVFDIEEMLCCPDMAQEYLNYIRMR